MMDYEDEIYKALRERYDLPKTRVDELLKHYRHLVEEGHRRDTVAWKVADEIMEEEDS